MPADELVLCTPRLQLPIAWLPTSSALALTYPTLAAALSPLTPVWLPRGIVETDLNHKQ